MMMDMCTTWISISLHMELPCPRGYGGANQGYTEEIWEKQSRVSDGSRVRVVHHQYGQHECRQKCVLVHKDHGRRLHVLYELWQATG